MKPALKKGSLVQVPGEPNVAHSVVSVRCNGPATVFFIGCKPFDGHQFWIGIDPAAPMARCQVCQSEGGFG